MGLVQNQRRSISIVNYSFVGLITGETWFELYTASILYEAWVLEVFVTHLGQGLLSSFFLWKANTRLIIKYKQKP